MSHDNTVGANFKFKETTVERLIGAFRRQNNVDGVRQVNLMIDGEQVKPNDTMKDIDIDDMDQLEVLVK